MRTLQQGSKGADVRRWQLFLVGQKLDAGPVDGDFGARTHKATMEFQTRYRLRADGVVGLKTLGQAMMLGFDTLPPVRDTAKLSPNWPPRPDFSPLVSTSERQKLFGKYRFVAAPVAGNAENIRIVDNWEDENIVRVPIPQISKVVGARRSGVRFHRKAAAQLAALWRDWEKHKLLHLILTWDGAFTPRFVRGSRSVLSNHAFGTAFDINASWNWLGTRPALVGSEGALRELVPIANAHGFYWGGHFKNRPDGMHFEIADLK